jgi:hypothetical protein
VISYAKANSKMADSLSKVKDILKIGKKENDSERLDGCDRASSCNLKMNFTVKLCVPSDRLNEASEAKGDKILYSKASLTTSNSFSSDFN